jgi:hypothetical protein
MDISASRCQRSRRTRRPTSTARTWHSAFQENLNVLLLVEAYYGFVVGNVAARA